MVPGIALAKGPKNSKGLSAEAAQEIRDAGMDKYLGTYTPSSSEDIGDGWTKHTFDTDQGDGTSVVVYEADPDSNDTFPELFFRLRTVIAAP